MSHFDLWSIVSQHTDEQGPALILEDDIYFLKQWKHELSTALSQLHARGSSWDVFFLDCVHLGGWNFHERGLQPAENCASMNAYLLSRSGACALLALKEEHDSVDHEGLMGLLQERGTCWTTLPKLALQTW